MTSSPDSTSATSATSAAKPPKIVKKNNAPKSTNEPAIVITNEPARSAISKPVARASTKQAREQNAEKQIRLMVLKQNIAKLMRDSTESPIEAGGVKIYVRKELNHALFIGGIEVAEEAKAVELTCESIDLIHKANPLNYTFYKPNEPNDELILDYLRGQGWRQEGIYLYKEAVIRKAPVHKTNINDRMQRLREKAKKKP